MSEITWQSNPPNLHISQFAFTHPGVLKLTGHIRPDLQALSDLFLVTPAYAQTDLTVSTPAINKLTAAMKARHSQLEPHYTSGAVGPTATVFVTIRDAKLLALKDRNRVKKLVSDENTDRNALYREIAKANKHPEWEASIRSTFARRWIAKAQPGWWYQSTDQTWQQKK